jgi:hypothetical protein
MKKRRRTTFVWQIGLDIVEPRLKLKEKQTCCGNRKIQLLEELFLT